MGLIKNAWENLCFRRSAGFGPNTLESETVMLQKDAAPKDVPQTAFDLTSNVIYF